MRNQDRVHGTREAAARQHITDPHQPEVRRRRGRPKGSTGISRRHPDSLLAAEIAKFPLATVYAKGADLQKAIVPLRAALELRRAWEKEHPSAYGDAAWQAIFHEEVGMARANAASAPGLADARRREHWRLARAEYARGLAIWERLSNGRPLEGDHAAATKRLEEAIAQCDDALAKLALRDERTEPKRPAHR